MYRKHAYKFQKSLLVSFLKTALPHTLNLNPCVYELKPNQWYTYDCKSVNIFTNSQWIFTYHQLLTVYISIPLIRFQCILCTDLNLESKPNPLNQKINPSHSPPSLPLNLKKCAPYSTKLPYHLAPPPPRFTHPSHASRTAAVAAAIVLTRVQ